MSRVVEFPQSRCLAGVARTDVTPPVGIYHRAWGAAKHDQSTGVHRPLEASVLALAPLDSVHLRKDAAIFISVDHCLLWAPDMDAVLDRIAMHTGVRTDQLTVYFSHTHAAGLMDTQRRHLPGGALIPAYLELLTDRLAQITEQALTNCAPADIAYGSGECRLARNRDFFDSERQQYVCGFNPEGAADFTVLAGRVTSAASGRTLATIVNYACHPTTLAWDNTLISPDYVGAMRETVESVYDAPCLFIQGASGDIGPRRGFTGDVSVADQNGRQLGYAALAVLEELPPPCTDYRYTGAVTSGTSIGTWEEAPLNDQSAAPCRVWRTAHSTLELELRSDLPRKESLIEERQRWVAEEESAIAAGRPDAARDARAKIEQMDRALTRVGPLPEGGVYPYPLRIWRIGTAVWLALDGEHYNLLQRELRHRFPDLAIVVGTIANGSRVWYLPDENSYGKGLYQEVVSVLERGSLERVLEALTKEIHHLISE